MIGLSEEASGATRVVATGVATFLLAVAVAAATHARLPLGDAPAFMPIFATLACGADALTAFLLVAQARVLRSFPLFVLAGAYAFAACAIVPHLAFFPGVFAAAGLFGASLQSVAWCWVWWHAGFALFAIGYVVACARDAEQPVRSRIGAAQVGFGLAGIVVAVGALAAVTRVCDAAWPALNLSAQSDEMVATGVGPDVLTIMAVALGALVLVTRLRTATQLWLAVALAASLLDCALTAIAGDRYTAAWYAARLESLFASTVVLCALLRTIAVAFERLARLSNVDGLTGLSNRRSFDERLIASTSLTLRTGGSLSLLLIDIDDFKHYNDRYGHVAGDESLRAIARTIARSLNRQTDMCARYGGEEFAVVLPATGAAGAERVAERMREAVRDLGFSHEGSPHGVLTVSIGVSTLTAHEGRGTRNAATLLTSADRAVARAKEAGRDRVAVADVPLPLTLPDGRSIPTGSG